jgi:hypothetical protein
MPSNFIKPGVCGICGTAVVQPPHPNAGWHNGHLFEMRLVPNQTNYTKLTLIRVRCMCHKESQDPRYYDHDGLIKEDRDPNDLYIF